jgi:hypothetical protein
MITIDVFVVNFCIKLLLILLEASEPLVAVRNVKTSIQCSLLVDQNYINDKLQYR